MEEAADLLYQDYEHALKEYKLYNMALRNQGSQNYKEKRHLKNLSIEVSRTRAAWKRI
jgi:hypothetical protein